MATSPPLSLHAAGALLPAWVPLRVVADRLWYTDSSITRRAYARSSDSRRPGTPARLHTKRHAASVKLSTSGKYAFGIRPAARGQIAYRTYFPGDADHAPAYSVYKVATIS